MTTIKKEHIIEVLKTVYDPEIPVNIVDLGLIYGIEITEEGKVDILMTLTAPGCPIGDTIAFEIKDKLMQIEGITDVNVEITFEPPWTMDRITEDGREVLRTYGFNI
ncbi:MAG: iron-sulfur cluster assembly protein [candidate division WOR-3 bacterium]|nr:iron-sulfur cluster assembly protein [candidate division WOR-3 bacterium]MDW8149998.1 iron-sulfur cluster assembly protein [candidate division WOR-3 bacterium]